MQNRHKISAPHYFNKNYDSKERFCSYWHQIDEILSLYPAEILEIGTGNGFVRNYLKRKNIQTTALDTDFRLQPDVAGSVLRIPFKKQTFDLLSCCQVLEHLPYASFAAALEEIYRVSRKYALLSLPDITTVYRIDIELPGLSKAIKKLMPHPFPRPPVHRFDGEHYWEIGKKDYPVKRIQKDIRSSGFRIIRTYRVFEFYYHRFFVMKKK